MSTSQVKGRHALTRGTIGWLVWGALAAALVGTLVVEAMLLGPTSCELAAGSSIYGEASWSWLPPGVACRWELELGGDVPVVVTSGPSWARMGMALVLAGWAAALRHRPAGGGR
jgi:hypothetical protein